jgi:hypothetical protein
MYEGRKTVSTQTNRCMFMSCHKTAGNNLTIKILDRSFAKE